MLQSLGLGGDGDEVDAIERVEAAFNILFDHADCEAFVTVGDVWVALLKEMKLDGTGSETVGLWASMVRALGDETLRRDEFAEVGVETRLI